MLKIFLKSIFSRTDKLPAGVEQVGHFPHAGKKVLVVGSESKATGVPSIYDDWRPVWLDSDPKTMPDIVCDARELGNRSASTYESIYCPHNLVQYHQYDVKRVLNGFLHVLADEGFAYLVVPDMAEAMRRVVEDRFDIDDFLYDSPAGPMTAHDVIYGRAKEGSDLHPHKTGFSQKSLEGALRNAGFAHVVSNVRNMEITAIAFKGSPDAATLRRLGISEASLGLEHAPGPASTHSS